MSEVPRRLCLLLLLAVLVVCLWRARTQSFTVDESFVYQKYVEKPLSEMAKSYDACNHVLHTLLMKASRSWFGNGEMALRVPSLLGAAIYLAAVYRLTLLLFPGWPQLLTAAALVLHPLLLDLMVAARGYGLAVGFFTWSLYYAILYLIKGFQRKFLWRSGVLAGLAVAANLTLLPPAGALGLVLLILSLRDGIRSSWTVIDSYGGPAVVVSFLLVVVPLIPATGAEFYFGTHSLLETSRSMIDGIAKVPRAITWWPIVLSAPAIGWVVLPVLFWLLSAGAVWSAARWLRASRIDFHFAPFIVTAGTLAFAILSVFAMHQITGMKYPFARSGVYLIPLFTLALLLGCRHLGRRSARAAYCFVAVLVLVYVNHTDNRYFGFWYFDAATETQLRRMQDDFAPRQLARPATIAVTPVLATTIGYYRIRQQMDWLAAPVTENLDQAETDYFLLTGSDIGLVAKRGLHVMYEDRLSTTVLARRTP